MCFFPLLADSVVSRNGTPTTLDGSDLRTYPLWGSSSTPLDTFIDRLATHAINDLGEWCNRCNNTATRGCDVIARANGTPGLSEGYAPASSTTGRHHVSPVVAGVIGAMVALGIAGILLVLTELSCRRHRRRNGRHRMYMRHEASREQSVAAPSEYELTAPDQKAPSQL